MNVRDWLYVDDHCRGIELVLTKGRVGETYNIGGGAELTNIAVIDAICAGIDQAFKDDPNLAIRFPSSAAAQGRSTTELKTKVTDRAGHDRRYAIDDRKISNELDYNVGDGFESRLLQTLKWYIGN
jgi:dTDP-glucose 4,6-dehydratase